MQSLKKLDMPGRNYISFSLHPWTYIILLVIELAVSNDAALDVHPVSYICSECSLPASSHALPLIQKTRSRLECASACSRREWCSRYDIKNHTGSGSNVTPIECSLRVHENSPYFVNTPSTLCTTTCVKVTNGSSYVSDPCAVASLTVLKINYTDYSLSTDIVHVRNLLAAGNDLMIQYDSASIKYATVANYVTIGNGSSEVCATVVDSDETSNSTAALLFLREFCTKSEPTLIPSSVVSWKVRRKENSNISGNNIVFTTGGNTPSLEEALNNGSEIKLIIKGNNSVVRAEIISQNVDKGHQIVAQTTQFDNGNYKIFSYYTSQQENTVLLDLSLGSLKNPKTQNADVMWIADACWTHLHTTDPQTPGNGPSINFLLKAIDEGRRIRVKFKIDKLVIYATPDFVGLDQHNQHTTVIVHVLRVLSQESFLGKLVKIPSLPKQPQWSHYYITSNGNINLISSNHMTPLSDNGVVDWYVEMQKYQLAYTSSSQNLTALARLVSHVLEGKLVRVKVHNGTNRIVYPCHVVQVINNGQEVKCQVNGQLGVDLLGPKISRSINLSSILTPILSKLVGMTTATGCFQSVVVLAYQGSIDYFLSCPGPSNSSQIRFKEPQEVDWFTTD